MPHSPHVGSLSDQNHLTAILARAVTMANAYTSPHAEDDLRMLRGLQARFVGRAAYTWVTKSDDDAHFASAAAWAARVHREVDPDLVLQACVFEAVYPTVEQIRIPAWVFEDLGEPVETRTFVYRAMLGRVGKPDQGVKGGPWDGGDVPDLSRPETLRWFYYRARRYLESGYEAIHLGQMNLVAAADAGFAQAVRLCALIRHAAARVARRGWVLLDAHGHGMAVNDRLLFDFTSRPMSARALLAHPPLIGLLKRGESIGGIHPGGWTCAHSAVLVEIDNWGGFSIPPDHPAWANPTALAQFGRWGYDEIAWFARLGPTQRAEFLRYARRWTRLQGDHWFFQPPLARSLGAANLQHPTAGEVHRYRANTASAACPGGFGDEAAVRATLDLCPDDLRPDPPAVPDARTPSGVTVPEPVSILGELQPLLGGVMGDASCPWSRLRHLGGGRFAATFALPLAGEFRFTIAVGGSQADLTNSGGVSGAPPWRLAVPEAGARVRIGFDYETRQVSAINPLTGVSRLV